jgi:hypothetical protein
MNLYWYIVYQLTIKPRLRRIKKFLPDAQIFPTGSRYVCNPPVLTTDIDFIVYYKHNLAEDIYYNSYTISNSTEYMCAGQEDKFISYRNGILNLIVTSDADFADGYLIATHICRRFNLRLKEERVIVHRVARDNYNYDSLVDGYLDPIKNLELKTLLKNFNGQYRETIKKAYMLQHNIIGVKR